MKNSCSNSSFMASIQFEHCNFYANLLKYNLCLYYW